jgi:multidrug efflux pump subunit AcrB
MSHLLSQFAAVVSEDPDVDGIIAFAGQSNQARMFGSLKPLGERKLSVDEVMVRIRAKTSRIPGAMLILQPVQDLRIGAFSSAGQYQYTLQGDNLPDLNEWAPKMLQKMRTLPGLADVSTNQFNRGLQAGLTIDRATAARFGITAQDIDNTLYDAFGQRQVSTMYTPINQYHVVMEADPQFWQNPDGLKHIYVRGSNGAQVPLSAIAHYAPSTTPIAVNHWGQFPSATISFNLLPGVALGTAVAEIQNAAADMGLPASIHGGFAGTALAFQASMANMPVLVALALISVYIVLGILYESLVHPITIISTLPSAGVGALLALKMFNTDLSVIAMIGIILLIGIVKKNAIMMIDFALDAERNGGKSPKEAIFQACLLRFRPITMTTMAALLGGLPLALGTGTGAELRRPLGIAIVGGLIFSQLLTLYTTPVVYLYLDRMRLFFYRLRHGDAPERLALGVEG